MEWIDIYGDKRRFELKEGNQVLAILEFVDDVYVGRDCLTKLDFIIRVGSYLKYHLNEVDVEELVRRADRELSKNWISKAESLSKAIAALEMGREVIVTDYALGQVVNVVGFDQDENKYVIFNARFKGIYKEKFNTLNMFESTYGERDVFMLPRDTDKVFVKHDAAVRECVSLNENLR